MVLFKTHELKTILTMNGLIENTPSILGTLAYEKQTARFKRKPEI